MRGTPLLRTFFLVCALIMGGVEHAAAQFQCADGVVLSKRCFLSSTYVPPYRGNLDVAECNVVAGWSCFGNLECVPNYAKFNLIHVYDGPAGPGKVPIASGVANGPREYAVLTACGGFTGCGDTPNHGFNIALPDLRDGRNHQFYVYAVNLAAPQIAGANVPNNSLIGVSQVKFCGNPPPPPPPPPTIAPPPTQVPPPPPTQAPPPTRVPPTNTPVPPPTRVPPTNTPVPPPTRVPPTNTPVPPTPTRVPPTKTPKPPTPTATATQTPRPTWTTVPPTSTSTPRPTRTPEQPTPTYTPRPTRTPEPPASTATPRPTRTPNAPEPTPTPSPTPQPVPIAECVDPLPKGGYIARFGYLFMSPTDGAREPIGPRNRFDPAPDDRGQPTQFFSGRVINAFGVEFNGEKLAWKLADAEAVATKDSPRCTTDLPPVCVAGKTPYTAACSGNETRIMLDSSGSSDPDGKMLTPTWTTDCAEATIETTPGKQSVLVLKAPASGNPQSCTVTLKVDDGKLTTTCTQTVSVTGCVKDCAGVPGGTGVVDRCGVCNGTNKCVDCAGVVNGTAVKDKCDVCDGKNACLDCAGKPNGTSKVDTCGVCAGDDSTCKGGCITSGIKDLLFALDSAAGLQTELIKTATKRVARRGLVGEKFVNKTLRNAEALKNEQWRNVWGSFPLEVKNCTDTILCTVVDKNPEIQNYITRSRQLRDIGYDVLKILAKANGGALNRGDKRLKREMEKLNQENETLAFAVPRFESVCSGAVRTVAGDRILPPATEPNGKKNGKKKGAAATLNLPRR